MGPRERTIEDGLVDWMMLWQTGGRTFFFKDRNPAKTSQLSIGATGRPICYLMYLAKRDRDSYHDRNLKAEEENCASVFKSRGARRYDPQTRRYVEWCIPGDPDSKQHDLNSIPSARYPRFTLDEMPKLQRKLDETRTGGQITPLKASDWNWTGPDVRFLPML